MAEGEDRSAIAGREGGTADLEINGYVSYAVALEYVRKAKPGVSDEAARGFLLNLFNAGKIKAVGHKSSAGRSNPEPARFGLLLKSEPARQQSYWCRADLEREFPPSPQGSTELPRQVGRPGIPVREMKALLGLWAEERTLTDNRTDVAKRLTRYRQALFPDRKGDWKGIYENPEVTAEYKRLTGKAG